MITRDGRDPTGAASDLAALIKVSAPESAFQRFFAAHPYVLSAGLGLRLDPRQIVPLGRPGRSEPDFLITPLSSSRDLGVQGVIELKRPSSPILTQPRKNVMLLSREADTAVHQALQYENATPLTGGRATFLGAANHLFVIMGLSNELSRKLTTELLQRQVAGLLPANCKIIPYDTLLRAFTAALPPRIHFLIPSHHNFEETLEDLEASIRMNFETRRDCTFSPSEIDLSSDGLGVLISGHGWPNTEDYRGLAFACRYAKLTNLTVSFRDVDQVGYLTGKVEDFFDPAFHTCAVVRDG